MVQKNVRENGGEATKKYKGSVIEKNEKRKRFFKPHVGVAICIVAMVVLATLGILIDYKDLFGDVVEHANFDFLTIYINTVIVVGMFVITYLMIDARNLKRTEAELNNKRQIMKKMLLFTYSNCSNNLKAIRSDSFDGYYKVVVGKNGIKYDDTKYKNFQNLPFLNDAVLIDLFCTGAMSADRFEKYMTIKNMYFSYTNSLLDAAMTGLDIGKGEIKKMLTKYVDETQIIIDDEIKILRKQ